MTIDKITINGHQYANPESMPPDVRRMYEEALRAAGPLLANSEGGESTEVFTSPPGLGIRANMVVNRTVVVNKRTYKNADEMPPDVRKLYEAAQAAPPVAQDKSGLHVSVNVSGPTVRSLDDSSTAPNPTLLPIEPSSIESSLRGFVWSLGFLVLGVLALLFFWDR